MKIGVALPHTGTVASADAIALVAREAEQMGFSSLWVLERLLMPVNPESGRSFPPGYRSVFDPIETLTYAAALTSTIRVGTSVMDAVFHSPVILAKRLATLDQLSKGRLIAGLGQGHMAEEFRAAGVPQKRRGAGFEELILAMKAAWGPDPVSFKGRFYEIAESYLGPKPLQPGGPKIVVGANAPAAIERAARVTDGFNPVVQSLETLTAGVTAFREAAAAAGRDPRALRVIVRSNSLLADTDMAETRFLSGTVAKIRDDIAQLRELEPDEVFFDFGALTPVDEQLRAMEQLIKEAD